MSAREVGPYPSSSKLETYGLKLINLTSWVHCHN